MGRLLRFWGTMGGPGPVETAVPGMARGWAGCSREDVAAVLGRLAGGPARTHEQLPKPR